MRSISMLLTVVLTLPGAGAWADAIYKCRNSEGELIYQGTPCAKNAQTLSTRKVTPESELPAVAPSVISNGTLILKQRGNHFFVDGTINGRPLTFVVDTGASAVVLPRTLAFSAQIYCRGQVMLQTAKGAASACKAVIPHLAFGPFQLLEVPALISPDLRQPLLGMSVLQQFRIEQERGEMRISPRK